MGRRIARRFEPFLAHVADVIRTAVPVKHLDETGLRIAARTRWLHVLCTPFLTVLRIGAGRGDVEKDLEGILIHDDYAAYFTLKGVRHGACNAHHLRELQSLIDIEKEDWAKSMHRLLERAHRATRFSRENGRDVPASLVARISQAWARILDHAILRGAAAARPLLGERHVNPHVPSSGGFRSDLRIGGNRTNMALPGINKDKILLLGNITRK